MSNFVFLLNSDKTPLNPVHPGKARLLLNSQQAAVFRRYPFTIVLKEQAICETQEHELKIDPGSKFTGIAILQGDKVIWGAEIEHRGSLIKDKILSRSAVRRGRRNRNTRYRKPRFLYRTRQKGWLAPSLMHRVLTTQTWVNRLIKYCPINQLAQEVARFDTQKMISPEITGEQYQQGTLQGYEVREYLLEKWQRKCAYCNKTNTPLQIEHIIAKSKGGSDRVSNLCLACEKCNLQKGNKPIEEFLKNKPDLLKKIKAQAKTSLKYAAAVNSTRWKLFNSLKETGLPVITGTGGQTKFNRCRLNLTKAHWIDAVCTSIVNNLHFCTKNPLLIKCRGQGGRQKAALNKFGYPIRHNPLKPIKGWLTGDIVNFNGQIGRLTPRSKGAFCLTTTDKKTVSIAASKLHLIKPIHRKDGYEYGQ